MPLFGLIGLEPNPWRVDLETKYSFASKATGSENRSTFKSTSASIPFSRSFLRKQESRRKPGKKTYWIPAFAGMTEWWGPNFTSPEGEGFPPSLMEKLKIF